MTCLFFLSFFLFFNNKKNSLSFLHLSLSLFRERARLSPFLSLSLQFQLLLGHQHPVPVRVNPVPGTHRHPGKAHRHVPQPRVPLARLEREGREGLHAEVHPGDVEAVALFFQRGSNQGVVLEAFDGGRAAGEGEAASKVPALVGCFEGSGKGEREGGRKKMRVS